MDPIFPGRHEPLDEFELPSGWFGPIAALDIPTGDERMLATPEGGLRTREYPMSLTRGHVGGDKDIWIGTMDAAWVQDGELWAQGTFDLGGDDGREAARQLTKGLNTVSIHPDEVTFEHWFVRKDDMSKQVPFDEAVDMSGDYPELREGYTTLAVMTDWRLASVASVSVPAYDEARIRPVYDYRSPGDEPTTPLDSLLAYEGDDEGDLAEFARQILAAHRAGNESGADYSQGESSDSGQSFSDSLIARAGAAGQVFARTSFANPNFAAATPLTVERTEDGRTLVYGHVALWGTCYRAFGNEHGTCRVIPKSVTGYGQFHLHGARLDDGSILPVGALTFGEGHRAAGGLRASQKLYADVATMAAKVRAGEDKFGVWVAGEVLDAFADRADDLLLSPLSGHWEPDLDQRGAPLEMLAAHVVVTPGFDVPQPLSLVASVADDGEILAMRVYGPFRTAEDPALEARREAALKRFGMDLESRKAAHSARFVA